MGAQRTVTCPRCGAPRVTKAVGRTKLSCPSCGALSLASQVVEVPEPELALVGAGPDVATRARGMDASTGPAPSGGIAAVEVLDSAELRIGDLGFPEPPPTEQAPAGDVVPPSPLANSQPTESHPPEPPPRVPSQSARRPRVGYYGRILR